MKKQSFQMKQWAKVCLALSLGLPLTACVDDSYDASKDIDMTMGLGSQGLQLKLGNTENIMLGVSPKTRLQATSLCTQFC